MSTPLDELLRGLRTLNEIAVAHRSAREPGSNGVGVTVSLRCRGPKYVVSVEHYRDDGGYGEKLSRVEESFDTLDAAVEHVGQQGFSVEDLKF
jgi:hypothetical protein